MDLDYMKLFISSHSLYWSIHTKDESKRCSAFAFIFGVNWLLHCGVTASFGVFSHEMNCNGMTSFMEFRINSKHWSSPLLIQATWWPPHSWPTYPPPQNVWPNDWRCLDGDRSHDQIAVSQIVSRDFCSFTGHALVLWPLLGYNFSISAIFTFLSVFTFSEMWAHVCNDNCKLEL